MKVAVLTQPLGHNYGGLLQAYALQTYLKGLGCEVETLDRRANVGRLTHCKRNLINVAKLMLGRIRSWPTESREASVLSELASFRDRRLVMSPKILEEHELRDYCRESNFDSFVVGSDQVWRPLYSPSILNFYLDFLDDIESPARRIAYAASFGVDAWEYSGKLTGECKELVQKFDVISVREASAVELCQNRLGVSAQWVVDPTLLLEPDDYYALIDENVDSTDSGGVLSYVLDPAPQKRSIAHEVGRVLGDGVFSIKPELSVAQVRVAETDKCRYPSVESWLQAFYSASFVVTDSFHGTVFSILFNKPFIAVGNSARGMARFESLLSQLGLLERLVGSPEDLTSDLILREIDWNSVNEKRKSLADVGRAFLKSNVVGSG